MKISLSCPLFHIQMCVCVCVKISMQGLIVVALQTRIRIERVATSVHNDLQVHWMQENIRSQVRPKQSSARVFKMEKLRQRYNAKEETN